MSAIAVSTGPLSLRTRAKDYRRRMRIWLADRLRRPGAIRTEDFHDLVLGMHFSVDVSRGHTRIQVGNRYYYFNRFTGKFDGTGLFLLNAPCCKDAPPTTQVTYSASTVPWTGYVASTPPTDEASGGRL